MGILPELFFSFARIGAFTFGGGYAMLCYRNFSSKAAGVS